MLNYADLNNKKELAENGKLKYFCHTAYRKPDGQNTLEDVYFLVEDVKVKPCYAELLTNGNCYHESLMECVQSLTGTSRPIEYHGVNINLQKRDVLLRYNVHTGECIPTYYMDYSILEQFEKLS